MRSPSWEMAKEISVQHELEGTHSLQIASVSLNLFSSSPARERPWYRFAPQSTFVVFQSYTAKTRFMDSGQLNTKVTHGFRAASCVHGSIWEGGKSECEVILITMWGEKQLLILTRHFSVHPVYYLSFRLYTFCHWDCLYSGYNTESNILLVL